MKCPGFSIFLFLSCILFSSIKAQDVLVEKTDTLVQKPHLIALPFSFYLKTIGVAGAVDIGTRGLFQKQGTMTLVGLVTTNGSRYLYFDGANYLVPGTKRLFFSPNINIAHYGALDVYIGPNVNYLKETAGNNASSKGNYYEITSNKFESELVMRYLLPIGYGRETVINRIVLDQGLAETGKMYHGSLWPFVNGRTFFEPGLFYQNQTMNFSFGSKKLLASGYSLGFTCENVDFVPNPSQGALFKFKYQQAITQFSSTVPWQMYEGSLGYYVPVKGIFRQEVLAFNLFTRYVPTFDKTITTHGTVSYERPTPFNGAFLGGRYRLRGFPEARFSDKAAWLYTTEYRVIPEWNPLANWNLLKRMNVNVAWLQWVIFAEAGRVAPDYNLKTFHTNMKTDAGIGLRFMVNSMVLRIDAAYSREGTQLQMYMNHPF